MKDGNSARDEKHKQRSAELEKGIGELELESDKSDSGSPIIPPSPPSLHGPSAFNVNDIHGSFYHFTTCNKGNSNITMNGGLHIHCHGSAEIDPADISDSYDPYDPSDLSGLSNIP
uniref:Uncharacterized protein n=1 Tax=Moniliophthora roreri TaxID=221103 RepID=A0A0W0FVX3_MONRR